MLLNEPGVMDGSHYNFFTPSETIKKHYYHLICCGHYYCNADYNIKRDYFPYFLLVYIRNGQLHVNYHDKSVAAKKGDILSLVRQYYLNNQLGISKDFRRMQGILSFFSFR